MIKRIDYINDIGIFKNFSWNTNIDEFKDKNIIYGWNYSGKTTLSRIFSSLKDKKLHNDYPDASFKVLHELGSTDSSDMTTFPYQIEVFNSDYIKDNLRWGNDENINAITFEVGDNAKISQRIEELQILIEQINGTDKIKGKKETYIITKDEFDSFDLPKDSLFSKEAKRIKDEVFLSLINFDKRNITSIKNYIGTNLDNYIIKSKKELENFGKIILITEPKGKLIPIEFLSHYSDIITLSKEVLEFVPSKSNIISILEKDNRTYEWAKQGLDLHHAKDKCAFCGNDLTEERYNELLNYFSNQASELKGKANQILDMIHNEEILINSSIISYSLNDFNDNFQDEFKSLRSEFDNEIAKYKQKLLNIKLLIVKKKDKSIYKTINIKYDEKELAPILDIISKINKLILNNNDFTDKFFGISV